MSRTAIIVPVYNVEKYLSKCIDSLLDQSDDDIEIVLINDGSTDSSTQICREYAAWERNRITLIEKTNGGQASARNLGLANTDSEYVAFVDADDFVHPDYIHLLRINLEAAQSDMSCCNMTRVDDSYKELSKNFCYNNRDRGAVQIQPRHLFEVYSGPCAKLFRRKLLSELNFPDIKYEDLATMPAITMKANRISFVAGHLYYYLIRPDSTIRKTAQSEDAIKAIEFLRNTLSKNGQIYELKNELEYLYIKHALICRAIQEWPSIEYMKLASSYGKSNFRGWNSNSLIPENEKHFSLVVLYYMGPYFFKLYRKIFG